MLLATSIKNYQRLIYYILELAMENNVKSIDIFKLYDAACIEQTKTCSARVMGIKVESNLVFD